MQRFLKKLPYILCFLVAFVFGMKELREPDIWWQLLSGRWMLEHGAITRTDMFSYTMAGQPWVNVKWLYEVIIAGLEKVMGPEVVLLLQCLINIAILWLLFRTIKLIAGKLNVPASRFITFISVLLFFVVCEYRMTGRPEMVSHLMCAIYLYWFWRFDKPAWQHVFVLALLQCLWANMHEGYPVGIVMIGTMTIGSLLSYLVNKDKAQIQIIIRYASLLGLACVAILLNPNGIQLWKQPFEIYRQVWANKYTTELYAYTDPQYWTIQAKIHVAIAGAVILFWIFRLMEAYKQKDKKFFGPVAMGYLLLIPLFFYLSLTANRNIPFAQVICIPTLPIAAYWLAAKFKLQTSNWYTSLSKRTALLASLAAIVLYVSVVNNSFYEKTKSVNKYGIHQGVFHTPSGAVAFLQQHNIKGPAFADYFVSSYLLWAMYPDFKSYIDLRDLDIFPEKLFDEYYKLYDDPSGFQKLDEQYNFNYVIISTSQLSQLQRKLYWGEGYNQVYADPVVVIFLKNSEQNSALNNNWGLQKLFNWPQPPDEPAWASALNRLLNPALSYDNEDELNAPVYSAIYYNDIGNYPFAIKQLAPRMYELADNAAANLALANSYLRYGDVIKEPNERQQKLDSAQRLYERALEINPNSPVAYSGLANVAILYANYKEAVGYIERYIELDKTNDYIYYLGAMCYRKLWKDGKVEMVSKMEDALKRSIALNPKNNKVYLYLAETAEYNGENDEAKEYIKKAEVSKQGWIDEEKKLLTDMKARLNIK